MSLNNSNNKTSDPPPVSSPSSSRSSSPNPSLTPPPAGALLTAPATATDLEFALDQDNSNDSVSTIRSDVEKLLLTSPGGRSTASNVEQLPPATAPEVPLAPGAPTRGSVREGLQDTILVNASVAPTDTRVSSGDLGREDLRGVRQENPTSELPASRDPPRDSERVVHTPRRTSQDIPPEQMEVLLRLLPAPGTGEWRRLSEDERRSLTGVRRRLAARVRSSRPPAHRVPHEDSGRGAGQGSGQGTFRPPTHGVPPRDSGRAAGQVPAGLKRKELERTPPSPLSGVGKKPRVEQPRADGPSYSGVTGGVGVALVPEGYPQVVFTVPQIRELLDRIFDQLEMMELGCGVNPKFDGHSVRAGGCLLTCRNQGSKDWIRRMAGGITLDGGVRVRAEEPGALNRTIKISGLFPGDILENARLLKRLMMQNEEIMTLLRHWQVCAQIERPGGIHIIFRIPEAHLPMLEERGFTLDYRDRRVRVYVQGERGRQTDRPAEMAAVATDQQDVVMADSDVPARMEVGNSSAGGGGGEVAAVAPAVASAAVGTTPAPPPAPALPPAAALALAPLVASGLSGGSGGGGDQVPAKKKKKRKHKKKRTGQQSSGATDASATDEAGGRPNLGAHRPEEGDGSSAESEGGEQMEQ